MIKVWHILQWQVKVQYLFTLVFKRFNESEFLISRGRSCQIWGPLKDSIDSPSSSQCMFWKEGP